MSRESVEELLREIRDVTREMVGVTEAWEESWPALASLLERRQKLMERIDRLHLEERGAPEGDEAQRILSLLVEIRDLDTAVRKAVELRRDEARKALEKARNERKGLAYIKPGASPGGGLVDDKG